MLTNIVIMGVALFQELNREFARLQRQLKQVHSHDKRTAILRGMRDVLRKIDIALQGERMP